MMERHVRRHTTASRPKIGLLIGTIFLAISGLIFPAAAQPKIGAPPPKSGPLFTGPIIGDLARQAEVESIINDYNRCIFQAAERYDDGKGSAHSVTLAIAPKCTSQYDRYITTISSGNRKFAEEFKSETEIPTAESVVKQARAAQNSKGSER